MSSFVSDCASRGPARTYEKLAGLSRLAGDGDEIAWPNWRIGLAKDEHAALARSPYVYAKARHHAPDDRRAAALRPSVLLNVELRASEIERLFAEARCGASPEEYTFHASPEVVVSGRVEEYVPGSVWLSVLAKRFPQPTLERLHESAQHASFGLARLRASPAEGDDSPGEP
jgi:hypothetical protein